MATQKKKSKKSGGGPIDWVRGRMQLAVPAAVFVGVLVAVGYGMWNRFGGQVAADPRYQLDPKTIEVTATPAWLERDVTSEVIRLAGLPESMNALDADLSERLADAFRLHPWVKRVESVEVLATNRARVTVVYHQPACMIEVEGGFLPVNREGMLLPTAGVQPEAAARFPRFAGVTSDPAGPVGSNWGDAEVVDAAAIAAALGKQWQALNLRKMRVTAESAGAPLGVAREYEIETRDQIRIVWGHAPGAEIGGESSAAEKASKLMAWRGGTATNPGDVGRVIDVRYAIDAQAVERTAARP